MNCLIKTGAPQFNTMTVKTCVKFEQNLSLGFQFSLPKSAKISSSRRAGRNFKFLHLVLAKRWNALSKNGHISFLSWQWRAVESFSRIWLFLSNSAYQKMLKFLRAGEKVEISNFFLWFWLKDELVYQKMGTSVSCHDSEDLCKVSAEFESWFPIQPTTKCSNFFQQARRSKFQISSFGFG